jgi:aspartokinase-like uncharacterized kinase
MGKLVVLKLSGHLINYKEVIKETLRELRSLTNIAKFVVIPGGSVFADFVRELQGRVGFNDDVAHWLAIKAMEMYGTYILSLDGSGLFVETYNLLETYNALDNGKIPILMPYKIVRTVNELPHSWDVTSDSIAVYIASLLKANTVILAKPLDSILDVRSNLIKRMTITELHKLSKDIIDPYTPELLYRVKTPLIIYNMLKPHLLRHIVNEEPEDYIIITS